MLQSPNIPQSSNMPELAYLPHGGIDIRYGIWGHVSREDPEQSDKPMIIILPGLSEFIEKYAILLAPLLKYDVDALILDWPSQGLSGRFLDQRLPVHIDHFDQYLDALSAVLLHVGITHNRPVVLFGHSMGGHLALRAAHELSDLDIRGVLISAPMMQLTLSASPFLSWGIWPLLRLLTMLGYARKPVSRKHDRAHGNAFYPDNPLTTDPDGYAVMPELWAEYPDAKTYEPTYGWVAAAYQSCRQTTASRQWLNALTCPVQAHLAEDESIVDAKIQTWSIRQIPQCESIIYPSARHELMLESTKTREAFWENGLRLLKDTKAI